MRIRSFSHKGLRRLYEEGQNKGVPAASVTKLRHMFLFLDAMKNEVELRTIATWKAHQLIGARKGVWSLHVTANWRLTFTIENEEICRVDLEDYH